MKQDSDLKVKIQKPKLYQGKNYPLECIGDQEFEKITSILFNCSRELKGKYDYSKAELIEGGSDKGRDVICYDENEEVNIIIQCKHSINRHTKMGKLYGQKEILKTIANIYLDKSMVKENEFKYILFIAYGITVENKNSLEKFFYEDVMEKDTILRQRINKLKSDDGEGFVKIREGIPKVTNSVLEDFRKIAKRMTIHVEEEKEIQSYLRNVEAIKFKDFFEMKIVIEKPKDLFAFQPNNDKEMLKSDEVKKHKEKIFYKELEKIELDNKSKEEALLDFQKKILWQLELIDHMEVEGEKLRYSLSEYEKDILSKENGHRMNYKDDILLTNDGEGIEKLAVPTQKTHSRKYYRQFMNDITREVATLRGFSEVPSGFTKGTCHDLVESKEIKGWHLGEKEE
ncbi:hypothetical protein PM10SUCC1_26250 [Propionigenium maris DSM 9537]|uniref:Uncharacterized protein n=1 Tax=Propionigenium maris DSM 9537 TaxID=1123000 RepID=A0A9W6GNU7_9FUSO|nr:hypothetical protein [Propionigenium maris]GLI57111.1 hypothetical protein PM10SUCC1_26250 [Propionigenium maris DSM 9537]